MPFPSPIQTILSVPDLHQVHRQAACTPSRDIHACEPGHGLTKERSRLSDTTASSPPITAGWEFHPTPKEKSQLLLWKCYHSRIEKATCFVGFVSNGAGAGRPDTRKPQRAERSPPAAACLSYASMISTLSILSRPWNLSTCSMPDTTLPNTVCWPSRCGCGWYTM